MDEKKINKEQNETKQPSWVTPSEPSQSPAQNSLWVTPSVPDDPKPFSGGEPPKPPSSDYVDFNENIK